MNAIYTPRATVDMLRSHLLQATPNVCANTVIPYRTHRISISMDSNHGDGDLTRSEIRIFDANWNDVTSMVFSNSSTVRADADALKQSFEGIDALILYGCKRAA